MHVGEIEPRWASFRRKRFVYVDISFDIQSKSVENQHAVFEWNTKMVAFTVRDLGSINGVSSCYYIHT